MEFMIHGYELTLRLADAEKIGIEDVRDQEPESGESVRKKRRIEQPGPGGRADDS